MRQPPSNPICKRFLCYRRVNKSRTLPNSWRVFIIVMRGLVGNMCINLCPGPGILSICLTLMDALGRLRRACSGSLGTADFFSLHRIDPHTFNFNKALAKFFETGTITMTPFLSSMPVSRESKVSIPISGCIYF
jgi:hypothetical protein